MQNKNKNLKVGFGTIGCSVKFRKEEVKRSDGSLEYYKMLWMLARNPSIDEIVIIQKSDWVKLNDIEKIEFDPRGVVRDVYSDDEGFSTASIKPASGIKGDYQHDTDYVNLWDHLKDERPIDFAFLFIGMGYMTNNSIPDFLHQIRNPSKVVRVQWVTALYCSPLIHYLNMSKIDWSMIALDPRYTRKIFRMRDTINTPNEIIAQYNQKGTWESVDSYEDTKGTVGKETSKAMNMYYTGIEKLSRINENIVPPDNKERTTKFMIVAMQSAYGESGGKDERFETIKEWILQKDKNNEVEIYGKWIDAYTNGWPQFKGFIPFKDVDKKLTDVRYTLIIPIRPNWVTSKWNEMLGQGVVPFMVPEYDTQYNVVPKDHFIRVKSPKDFYTKMKYLDENPEKRIKLVKGLQLKLLKDARSGLFVYDIVNEFLKRQNKDMELVREIDETVIRKTTSKTLF